MSTDGWAYMQIEKGMPGLKQAGKITIDRLKTHMKKYYTPVPCTPALWKHETGPTPFTLGVENVGIKYETIQDANHLLNVLKDVYAITIDWL